MRRRGRSLLRERRLIESSWLGEMDGSHLWEVRVESGTYVKELVSGDGGRTRPSLAEALGRPCRCAALDVLDVHWLPPWEDAAPRRRPAAP
jgi:tRNA pseudouridine synthase 10